MNDERTMLEQRVAWLEFKIVRLIWAAIGVVSLGVGFFAYILTVDHFGRMGAFGFAPYRVDCRWLVSATQRIQRFPYAH